MRLGSSASVGGSAYAETYFPRYHFGWQHLRPLRTNEYTYVDAPEPELYDRKNALVAAEMLNDRVLPFFEEQGIPLLRVLNDRGTEYCGRDDRHPYQIFLGLNEIDHTRTKVKHP